MAITSIGYDGSVSESGWAVLAPMLGTEYAVADSTHYATTVNVSADRTVTVSAGTAYGQGVVDVNSAPINVQLGTISSGSRWDLICLRRNWVPATGVSTVVAVPGNATRIVPAGRSHSPGVQDDQPLALVQVTAGSTLPTSIVDLRVFASKVLSVSDLIAMPNPRLGTELVVAGLRYRRELDVTLSPAWVQDRSSVPNLVLPVATGGSVFTTATGWGSGTPAVCRAMTRGNVTHIDIESKRLGARIPVDTNGSMVDTIIGTVLPPFRPTRQVPVDFLYFGASSTSPTAFYVWGGKGYLQADGTLTIVAGQPNQYINQRTDAVSIRAQIIFMTES